MLEMPEEALVPEIAAEPLRGAKLKQCARCSPGVYRRVNRSSWLERTVLTWLGYFPWECVSCRRKRFFRDQGKSYRVPGQVSR
jgi:hypothetical protein